MAKTKVPFSDPWYPYGKIDAGYMTMRGLELVPYKVLTYLMDMSDAYGYVPIDDNERARVRLAKYLYYDGANPLANPLPTDEQKMSMLFDGNNPVLNTDEDKALHPVGYRLFPQSYWSQAELDAKTVLKCYVNFVTPRTPYRATIGLAFEVVVNCGIDNTTKTMAYSRSLAMEQCLVEALHGVNIFGVGSIAYNRRDFGNAGSSLYHDEGVHIYRPIQMSCEWEDSIDYPNKGITEYN